METRNLGRSGLKVTTLCLGGNVFGWTCDEAQSFTVLDAFVEAGGNFVDTADVYSSWAPGNSGGESETILGRWLAARGGRARMVIATKAGSPMGKGPNERGLSRGHIMAAVEASLRRLQTDYIDLYQTHYDDPRTPLEETMRALDDLVTSGKVRYIGASNISAWRLAKALGISDRFGLARDVSMQPMYNVVLRADYEREMEPLCVEEGVGVIPYSSMADGFLSGKYREGAPLPASARATDVRDTYMNERGWRVLAAVEDVAKAHGVGPAQVAMAWLTGRVGITSAIASATTPEQLRELVAGVGLALTAEQRAVLAAASTWT